MTGMEPDHLGIFQMGRWYKLLKAFDVRATFTLHHYLYRGACRGSLTYSVFVFFGYRALVVE